MADRERCLRTKAGVAREFAGKEFLPLEQVDHGVDGLNLMTLVGCVSELQICHDYAVLSSIS